MVSYSLIIAVTDKISDCSIREYQSYGSLGLSQWHLAHIDYLFKAMSISTSSHLHTCLPDHIIGNIALILQIQNSPLLIVYECLIKFQKNSTNSFPSRRDNKSVKFDQPPSSTFTGIIQNFMKYRFLISLLVCQISRNQSEKVVFFVHLPIARCKK